MTLGLFFKLLHVLSAIFFISGILGRAVTFRWAGREKEIGPAYALLQVSEVFERKMLIPASTAVLVTGILTAWVNSWPMGGFLQGARTNWLLLSILLMLASFLVVPLYLVRRRRQRTQAAEEAVAAGEITPDLSAAFQDRGVWLFRTFELVAAIVIVILMVTKPF